MTIEITSLFSAESFATVLARGLEVAKVVGLPVTSWRVGDPTRTLFRFAARVLANREGVTAEYIKAGFLSTATGDWLTVLALEVYGVERVEATYATSTVSLLNSGGGSYTLNPGDVTVKSAASGKTYTNTNTVVLAGLGTTGDLEVTADESGSDSSAAVDEIDTLVTTFLGVSITASTAAVGADEQDDDSLKTQCQSTLGALSPNGPPDAYEYVCRNSELTGTTEITRATSVPDDPTGVVTVYVAGSSGAVSGAAVTLAQSAVEVWATPLTVTPTVVNAMDYPISITCTVSGDNIPAIGTVQTAFESAIGDLFAAIDIGGIVSYSAILSKLHVTLVGLGATNVEVAVSIPAASIALGEGYVATLGFVTPTEV